ncbi:DUF305 domain-containing protein [Thermoactinospora rubra]|uniref:DUF305 domain-containing protein n=1 Tax=Thermoactinospora rubra TaxID=1088767 RepID=UPI000A10DC32|nr:DUF305 domain-containing protein [Thermoactinospora rubra]
MAKALTALLAALLLTGCGGAAAPAPTEAVDADDVMFLQMMIPHHRQGIQIARLARERATHPEVRTLAAAIETTQDDEVARMSRWLYEWDQPLTAASDAHAGHEVPETDKRQIAALLTSKRFDRDLLNVLIAHQDEAVQLAAAEQVNGASPKVREWARQVEQSRRGQIALMLDLLEELP